MSQSTEEDSSRSVPTEKISTPEQDVANGSLTSSKLLLLRGVKMENGRANLDALLKEEISMASGSMSVSGKY
jgi:ferric-chelate reductase